MLPVAVMTGLLAGMVAGLQLYSASNLPAATVNLGPSSMASPLAVFPELKESRLCSPEGEQKLVDDANQYIPAYPGSSALGGFCRFEDFEEGSTIGHGAFGEVIEAVHIKTGVRVAIKELTRPVEYKHIRREECLQHSCHSPLIVRHYCTISQNGYIAMVMELVDGITLYKARKRFNNLPIVSIAAQVVLMIEYLHERFILYRDLKPENIMWDPLTHKIKLIDFGLAHRLHGRDGMVTGQAGTPPFMAPEVIISATSKYSYPADWYSVGMVIFELISGRNPFDNIQDTNVLQTNILHGFDCNLADQTGCHLIKRLTEYYPDKRWGATPTTLRRIKRHPWFSGIPWTDYANGHIEVQPLAAPMRRRSSRRPRSMPVYSNSNRGNHYFSRHHDPRGKEFETEMSALEEEGYETEIAPATLRAGRGAIIRPTAEEMVHVQGDALAGVVRGNVVPSVQIASDQDRGTIKKEVCK